MPLTPRETQQVHEIVRHESGEQRAAVPASHADRKPSPWATVLVAFAGAAAGAIVTVFGGGAAWGGSQEAMKQAVARVTAVEQKVDVKADKSTVDAIDARTRVNEQASAANTAEHAAMSKQMDDVKKEVAEVRTQQAEANRKLDLLLNKMR